MKLKIFTLLAFCAFMNFGTIKAQLYLEENFDYPVDSFIKHPVISTQNLQAISGWSTQTSSNAINNCWNITTPGLNYTGYYEGYPGYALSYVGNSLVSPSVYKSWKHAILQDSTFYVSYLINFASNPAPIMSPDFFFGINLYTKAFSFVNFKISPLHINFNVAGQITNVFNLCFDA